MKITYKEIFTRYIDDDFLDKHYDYKNNNIDLDSAADPETIINTNDGKSTELSEIWRVFGFKPEYTLANVYPDIWKKWTDFTVSPEDYFFMCTDALPLKINGTSRAGVVGFRVNFIKNTWVGDTILDIDLKEKEDFQRYLEDNEILNRIGYHLDVYDGIRKILKENERISYRDFIELMGKRFRPSGSLLTGTNIVLDYAKAPVRLELDDLNLNEDKFLNYEDFKEFVNSLEDYALQFTLVCLFNGILYSKNSEEGIPSIRMSDIDKTNKTVTFNFNEWKYTLDIDDYFIEVAERCYSERTYIERRNRYNEDMVMYYNMLSEYVIKSKVSKKTELGLAPVNRGILDKKLKTIEYSHKDITHMGGIHRLRQIQLRDGFERLTVKLYHHYLSEIAPIRAFNITEFMRKYNDVYAMSDARSFNVMEIFNK